MSKKNDPAFLFYSKDWIQGTAQMTSDEKGVYIDLLCHQHQDMGLPISTKRLARMVNISEEEFLKIWDFLKEKFIEKDGKLFNKKLDSVITGRSEHAEIRGVIGTFGRLLKDLKISDKKKGEIRKLFNYRDFLEEYQQNQQNFSKALSNWLTICSANIPATLEDEDGNGNEDGNEDYINNSSIVSEMFKIFKKYNSSYPHDKKKDFIACYHMAVKIGESKGWEPKDILNGKKTEVLKLWDKIVTFVVSDKWFSGRSLKDLNEEWQRLIQSMNGRYTGNKKEASTSIKKESDVDFDKYKKK